MHLLAYIDPGAGALVWQSIVGIFVGLIFYLRRTRRWLGRMLARVLRLAPRNADPPIPVPADKGKVEVDPR